MRDINNADPLCSQIIDTFEQAVYLIKCQGAGRLVQNQDLRMTQETSQDLNHLLLGNRQAVGLSRKVNLPANLIHHIDQFLM